MNNKLQWFYKKKKRHTREFVECVEQIVSSFDPPPMPPVKLPERFMTGHGLVAIKEIIESAWFVKLAKDNPTLYEAIDVFKENDSIDPMEWAEFLIARLCEVNKQLMADFIKRHQRVPGMHLDGD